MMSVEVFIFLPSNPDPVDKATPDWLHLKLS